MIGGGSWYLGIPEGVLIGAVLASPYSIVMLLLILRASFWVDRHTVLLCLLGPFIVCLTSYVLIVSTGMLTSAWMEEIMLSSAIASIVYFVLERLPCPSR
ncbi:hypothetical protein [Croceicoccus bisphenolivorans]|uniref:hypothetical protein n=1 Tax=Croceicoccus bisphenolivorans TaxID=1783232 RepID=UPI001C12A780|nr:hypothetical protein [Croceicoccus bisphenolivorans]